MKKRCLLSLFSLLLLSSVCGRSYFVSPTGNDSADGNINSPLLTINKAVDLVQPGDTIFVRGGTYMLQATIRIKAKQNAREDARIYLWAYNNERVIIDGSQIPHTDVSSFKMARCIYVNHEANYWHFKGLELCNAKDNGMKLEGSYNIVENCKFYGNNDTGLQVGMYKDFGIEETKSLPPGTPEFNPGYQFCRNNIILNCDSWYNYDKIDYQGKSDNGGDADGFACKLFPGPGTEFYGCRAWNNSDDNWDLYMVYHPIVIDNCWSWKAGYDSNNTPRENGNGFKLGGGGTAGGAAFSQSIGTHLVRNCVSFESLHKGFDQNNAYEAMYLFNNVAWGNEYNYRFPTEFKYGTMYMRNNIGWGATAPKNVGNHEFLSANKAGSQVPDTDYNSWTLIDGCDPYKEGNKIGGTAVYTKDHSSQFKSLSSTLFLEDRQSDGSLPDNDFAKLKENSYFIDKGQIVENFALSSHLPDNLRPVDYQQLPNLTISYNDAGADMGAFESGISTNAGLKLFQGTTNQLVFKGTAITAIIYKWSGASTDVKVEDLPEGVRAEKDVPNRTVTIMGNPTTSSTYKVTTIGGDNPVTMTGTISVSEVAPATLVCTTNNSSQTVNIGNAINDIVFEYGGGATDIEVQNLPAGLEYTKKDNKLTISGTPVEDGTYSVTATGGMAPFTIQGGIERVIPTKVLTGDWYKIQDEFGNLPSDLNGIITMKNGSDAYPVEWDPAYKEKNDVIPSGCTEGAINVERGGRVTWNLPSLVEFKANLHFTGSRKLRIEWEQDGETKFWETPSTMSATTLKSYDFMAQAGIEPTKSPIKITFVNPSSSGGTRIYDFFIRVYDSGYSSIREDSKENLSFYQTETALIAYGDIAMMRVYSLSGNVVAQSQMSQIVDISHLNSGVYVALIQTKDGAVVSRKFVKK
ncbi:T9SS type A sorting domain-containing protein [Dysgonomonas sp. 520]|uniref:T9SS type A sorting domain-containing protein n=1 Tax=Dysgonomonas sp. 520 TaxID=2302931 RepID=UPI0013D27D71|nr:T9SS type A sorting domain-containing protein [Dysgonomonas sp. 520]NDW10143.1 T9SS C-terminal target domain-containing protein [Dysgonomonas sp. 520]